MLSQMWAQCVSVLLVSNPRIPCERAVWSLGISALYYEVSLKMMSSDTELVG